MKSERIIYVRSHDKILAEKLAYLNKRQRKEVIRRDKAMRSQKMQSNESYTDIGEIDDIEDLDLVDLVRKYVF